TLCPSNGVTFSVAATGTGLTYQWRKDGTNLFGATDTNFSIGSVTAADAGSYDVVVTAACGSQTDTPAVLVVNSPVAVSGGGSQNLTKCPGDTATFTVSASGTGLKYQWQHNGAAIIGATNSSYTILSVTTNNAGAYGVVLTGTSNSLTAAVGSLTVNQPVSVQPLNGAIQNVGGSVSFTAIASGTGPFTYVWKK